MPNIEAVAERNFNLQLDRYLKPLENDDAVEEYRDRRLDALMVDNDHLQDVMEMDPDAFVEAVWCERLPLGNRNHDRFAVDKLVRKHAESVIETEICDGLHLSAAGDDRT